MRPLYFCANCKQYHTSCKQNNIHQSSSVQYLRFSDLFCVIPNAHPQNFTLNSPRAPENSRLVYANQYNRKCHSANKKILIKVNSSQKYGVKPSNYPHSSRKQSRNTTGQKSNKYKYTDMTTAKKKPMKNGSNITRLKTHDTTINDLSEFRDKIRTHQKQKVSNLSEMNETNIQQDDRKSKRTPYYVISKIQPQQSSKNESKNSRNQLNISGAEESLAQKIRSKEVNGSYVYGDHDRKILTSDTKIKQFQYGDPTDSIEDLLLHKQATGSSHYAKISLPPKSQPPRIKQSQDKKLNRSIAKHSLYESQQMNAKQSQVGHLDYANKIRQLRTVLKSNQKNYNQKTQQKLTQKRFDLHQYEQSPPKQKRKQISYQNIQQQCSNSNFSKQQLRKKVKLKIANKLVQHQPSQKSNNIFCAEPQHCKYFDNRCFGLTLCGGDQINYITGPTDLV